MKKFRRIISGFLAAALILTQSMTTAYSDDLPDAAGTTTSAAETTTVDTEGEADSTTGETSASDDETSQPEEGDPEDTDTDTTESADGDEKGEDDEGEAVEYIEITALPTKTVYFIGDDFDLSGGKFTVYHANGESEELDMAEELSRETLVVTGYDAATLGEQTITLTYLEKTVSFTVSVVADPENDTETESATYADGSSEGVLTLKVGGVEKGNYPNFEQAFAAVEPDRVNTITVNEDISVPYGEFTLPTNLGEGRLEIEGKTGSETITLNGVTSLSPGYRFSLNNLKLVPLDSNGNNLTSFTISGSKYVYMQSVTIAPATTVNVSVGDGNGLYIEATSAEFGALTGTTTSLFQVRDSSITADKVTNFRIVYANSPITVNTSMTGVGELNGKVILPATATATITTLNGADITLLADENGKFAKPTITNVDGNSTFTVKDSTGASTIAVPSGTPIFTFNGTEAQFEACKELISIKNKIGGETGNSLTPYYYNKEIRAEYDGVLTLNDKDYPNFEKAFAAVEANEVNIIYINEDINVPYGKFTLPTNLGTEGSLKIEGKNGSETLTLNGVTSLSPGYGFSLYHLTLIPLDSSGNNLTSTFTISGSKYVDMQAVAIDPATTVNLSVGAGSELNIETTSAKFGTLTGTTTSILKIRFNPITADKITTFGIVDAQPHIIVNTSMTGVGDLYGGVILPATATATITTLNSADITLLDDAADGLKLAKPTITNVAYDSTFTVKDSTGANTIAVPSGTPIFTFNGTEAQFEACKNNISIANKTATGDTGKTLTPFYYSREIRAEYADMLMLIADSVQKGSYPNFEKAFAAVEANKPNYIYISEDINVPYGKFTLPTAAQIGTGSLNICGSTGDTTLTLNGVTSLSPRYQFTLNNLKLVPLDSNGKQLTSFTISGSKKVLMQAVTIDPATTVNVSVGAGSNLMIWDSSTVKFGALTGTTTSDLEVHGASITADKVTTFSTVNAYFPITVNTSMTGVGELYGDGDVILSSTATATITTIYDANITLLDDAADGLKFAKPTITNITGDSTFTVKDSTGASTIAVPSGTPIFTFNGTEAQFDDCKNNIAIENKTGGETGNSLTPYYYNKEVRAEWAGMLTLKVDYVETGSFPNFEKAFAAVEANKRNHIYINEDINVPYGKFTLPTAAQIGTGSLNICGSTGDTTLTLNGVTSLSPRYQFTLNNLKLVPLDSNGKQLTSFTISGSKKVLMQAVTIDPATTVNVSVGAGSNLMIWDSSTVKFGALTGTTTSDLEVHGASITADKVTTFSTVNAYFPITVNTSMTGVGELYGDGDVILSSTATATITTIYDANITLLDDAADGLKFAKPTITNITGDSTFTVKDSTGASTIAVPSGTPIFTFNGTEAQFDDCKEKITIANKTEGTSGNSLSPCYYNREIRAEVPDVIELYVEGEIDSSFTSFEKLFQRITTLANSDRTNQNDYVVVLCDSVTSKVFTLPTYGASFTVKSEDGEKNSLTLIGATISYKNYPVHFDNVDLSVVKAA